MVTRALATVLALQRPSNTEISSEDRAILAIAGFACFISLLCSAFKNPRASIGP